MEASEHLESTWPGPHEKLDGVPVRPDSNLNQPLPDSADFKEKGWTLAPPNANVTYQVNSRSFLLLKAWLADNVGRPIVWGISARASVDVGNAVSGQTVNDLQKGSDDDGSYPAERVMDAFAAGLTLAIRNTASPREAARGTAQGTRVFVKARWQFAILPLVLVTMACCFMAATLWATIRKIIPIWKSSALASLAHGLGDSSSDRVTAHKLDEIERAAKGSSRSMRARGNRWKLEIPD